MDTMDQIIGYKVYSALIRCFVDKFGLEICSISNGQRVHRKRVVPDTLE